MKSMNQCMHSQLRLSQWSNGANLHVLQDTCCYHCMTTY